MDELQAAIYQATCFYEDAERFNYDITFPELQFSKGERNYNRILSRLKKINLPNPLLFKYTTLTIDELKEYLVSLLTKILGPEYTEEITRYNSLLKARNISNPFDSVIETNLDGKEPVIEHIYVSNKFYSIQVASTAHEYVHGLLNKYNQHDYNRVLTNIHYKELLSILIEYIICYELSELFKEDSLQEKHDIIRLHVNKQHASEHESSELLLRNIQAIPPILAQQYKLYMAYENHSSFGYITSDIYATRLFEHFKDDPKTLLLFIKRIIDGEKSIKELLKHYNIALNNSDTFASYNKRLDNIPKL